MAASDNPPSPRRLESLPGFDLVAPGTPGADAIEAYRRDGVVWLRGALDEQWVDQGRRAVSAALRQRTQSDEHWRLQKSGESGVFFFDTFLWKRLPSWRRFTFESPAASIARQVMQSRSLLLYFDMAIVKEPGTSARTPWHYDEAYWPVSGSQVCNVWIALDQVPVESALRFVLGSHRFEEEYRARRLQSGAQQAWPDPAASTALGSDRRRSPDRGRADGARRLRDHQLSHPPLCPG